MSLKNTEFNEKTGHKVYGNDLAVEQSIDQHCKSFNLTGSDLVANSLSLMRRQHLKRFLLHNELFQKTLNVPGDIVELGVYRGLGLMTWANLLECHCIGDRTKRVIGFDNWSGFSTFSKQDGKQNKNAGKTIGGFDPSQFKKEVENAISIFNSDRFIPWKDRIILIDGAVEKTVPKFTAENPGVRYSLIHFDVDLYKPTKVALEYFWDKLSRGGILIFDEYSIPDWPGETQAVDEFLQDKPELKLQTSNWTNTPAAWLIKP